MKLVDTVKLATSSNDGYGDSTVNVLDEVHAVFIQRSGIGHALNADGVVSDASVYLDKDNPVVKANMYRLEGMYIIANPFGQSEQDSWYRITHVTVGQRKLLNNAIDNIHCTLEKVAGVPYVSIS